MSSPLCICPVSLHGFLQLGQSDFNQCAAQSKPMMSAIKPSRTSSCIPAPRQSRGYSRLERSPLGIAPADGRRAVNPDLDAPAGRRPRRFAPAGAPTTPKPVARRRARTCSASPARELARGRLRGQVGVVVIDPSAALRMSHPPLAVVSGFRKRSFYSDSRHPRSEAVDFSIPGVPNAVLRQYLLLLEDVGVGA